MTRVEINKQEYVFVAEGHAGSAAVGQDIVCASVSTLTYTFLTNLDEMKKRNEIEEFEEQIDEDKGHVYIRVKTNEPSKKLKYLFEVISLGFRALSINFPNYIEVVIK